MRSPPPGSWWLNASSPDSGQSVAHPHFHVVPCWADDRATLWPAVRSEHRVTGPAHELLAAALNKSRRLAGKVEPVHVLDVVGDTPVQCIGVAARVAALRPSLIRQRT
jgi:diadenosine tetraphosphate (Ap4A) HIT family hydrolase